MITEMSDDDLRRHIRARLSDRLLFSAIGISALRRGTGRPCSVCGRATVLTKRVTHALSQSRLSNYCTRSHEQARMDSYFTVTALPSGVLSGRVCCP